MDIGSVVDILVSAAAGLVSTGTLLFWRSRKQVEAEKARQEKNLADAGEDDTAERRYKRMRNIEYELERTNKKLYGMQRFLTVTTSQKRYAEFHICTNIACQQRVPPLGTFKTEDFDYNKVNATSNEQGIEQQQSGQYPDFDSEVSTRGNAL